MESPLVTVICLCFNQALFVKEAIQSILNQSYKNIEIIIIDDCSTDGSLKEIENFIIDYPTIPFIQNLKNEGNCISFNMGLKVAKGKYIIDFSCDDIALPNRIEEQVKFFENQSSNTALIYSNAEYCFENKNTHIHFGEKTNWKPFTGWVYKEVLREYFIPTATIMFRTKTLINEGGYDEYLAYEDFDIWVRLSRKYKFEYQNKILTTIRKTNNSMSTRLYKNNDQQVYSTYLICKKAQLLNKSIEENDALAVRVKYELRMCLKYGLKNEFQLFFKLLKELNKVNFIYTIYYIINKIGIKFK